MSCPLYLSLKYPYTTIIQPKEDGLAVAVKKVSNPALLVPCFQLKNAEHEGWMYKLGGSGFTPKNWRRRWFVLKDKKLYYYKTAFVSLSSLKCVLSHGLLLQLSGQGKQTPCVRIYGWKCLLRFHEH